MKTYEVLWNYLNKVMKERLTQVTVYENDKGIEYLRNQSISVRLLSMVVMKLAILKYELWDLWDTY